MLKNRLEITFFGVGGGLVACCAEERGCRWWVQDTGGAGTHHRRPGVGSLLSCRTLASFPHPSSLCYSLPLCGWPEGRKRGKAWSRLRSLMPLLRGHLFVVGGGKERRAGVCIPCVVSGLLIVVSTVEFHP